MHIDSKNAFTYVEYPKEWTKHTQPKLELISDYRKVARYKINTQKSIVSYMNNWNLKFKTYHYINPLG